MRKQSRQVSWTAALLSVAAVAAVGALLAACGGSVALESASGTSGGTTGSGGSSTSSTSSGGSGAGGSAGCPATEPQPGEACADGGKTCSYPLHGCGGVSTATCSAGAWTVETPPSSCLCPTQVPVDGSPCDPCCTERCNIGVGTCTPVAQCSASGTWQVFLPNCPLQPCSSRTDPTSCETGASCRWLVPGCGVPATFTAGCFDAADCVLASTCPSGQSCIMVDTDPCWDSNCAVCGGGTANVCAGPG